MTGELTATASQPRARLTNWAIAAMAIALLSRFVWVFAGQNNFNFVDLRVYLEGANHMTDGTLYDFAITKYTPDQALPFTYPPFAAIVFYPMHFLPFTMVAIIWILLTVALMFLCVKLALALVADIALSATRNDLAIIWTALALWTEPVRTNLDFGQVNVVLMALVLGAAYVSRDVVAGTFVGIAAGVKLTPAIAGLYFLAVKRWWAALFSAVAFAATIGISYIIIPDETHTYFTKLIGDTSRIGRPIKWINQSARGTISRFVGHDIGTGPIWIAAVAVSAALFFAAWWAVREYDRLIVLLLVQFFGLVVSPISWVHHWVWAILLLVWLVHGPMRGRAMNILAGVWFAYLYIGVEFMAVVSKWLGWGIGSIGYAFVTSPDLVLTAATLITILVVRYRPLRVSA